MRFVPIPNALAPKRDTLNLKSDNSDFYLRTPNSDSPIPENPLTLNVCTRYKPTVLRFPVSTMKKVALLSGLMALGSLSTHAQLTVSPLTGFGGADGWLTPAEYSTFLTTANTERGLAYGNGSLYLVSRNGGNSIRILNPLTGAETGALNMTGVSGGTFAINMVGVAADGAIYGANLASPVGGSAPFKIYRWADNAAVPTVAYSSTTATAGRLGDTFDVIGSGTTTILLAGESNSSGTGARNGYLPLTSADGINFTGGLVTFASTPPNAGDFRLGLTFTDASHVLGTQGSTGAPLRYTGFSGTTGTLLGTAGLVSTAERPMDFAVVNGLSLLATISTGDSRVRVYDATDPGNLTLLATTTASSSVANAGANGAVAWGEAVSNGDGTSTVNLYAMNANNGIQAFAVHVPEPAALGLIAVGLVIFALVQKIRR